MSPAGRSRVVRHQIDVLENEFDRFAGLHHDHFLVVRHAFGQGADADHADAQLSQFGANLLRLVDRQQACRGVGELQGVEAFCPVRSFVGIFLTCASIRSAIYPASSFAQYCRGMRWMARMAARRSLSSLTYFNSLWNVLVSWPRTVVRAVMAARRTMAAGSSPAKVEFGLGSGRLVDELVDVTLRAVQDAEGEAAQAAAEVPSSRL